MCIYAYRRRPKTNVLRRLITIVFKWAARRKSVVETTKTTRLIGYVGIEGVGSKSARGDFLLLITKIRSHFRRILSSGRYAAGWFRRFFFSKVLRPECVTPGTFPTDHVSRTCYSDIGVPFFNGSANNVFVSFLLVRYENIQYRVPRRYSNIPPLSIARTKYYPSNIYILCTRR